MLSNAVTRQNEKKNPFNGQYSPACNLEVADFWTFANKRHKNLQIFV